MTDKTKEALEHAIDMAIGHGFDMNRHFVLKDRQGTYVVSGRRDGPMCHPLETTIVGQPINDAINVQVANFLGVTLAWVDGFVDGYGGFGKALLYVAPDEHFRLDYLEGYRDGEDIDQWIIDYQTSYVAGLS